MIITGIETVHCASQGLGLGFDPDPDVIRAYRWK
jgi:hypothetical protein